MDWLLIIFGAQKLFRKLRKGAVHSLLSKEDRSNEQFNVGFREKACTGVRWWLRWSCHCRWTGEWQVKVVVDIQWTSHVGILDDVSKMSAGWIFWIFLRSFRSFFDNFGFIWHRTCLMHLHFVTKWTATTESGAESEAGRSGRNSLMLRAGMLLASSASRSSRPTWAPTRFCTKSRDLYHSAYWRRNLWSYTWRQCDWSWCWGSQKKWNY